MGWVIVNHDNDDHLVRGPYEDATTAGAVRRELERTERYEEANLWIIPEEDLPENTNDAPGLSEGAAASALTRLGERGLVDASGWENGQRTYALTAKGVEVERALNSRVEDDEDEEPTEPPVEFKRGTIFQHGSFIDAKTNEKAICRVTKTREGIVYFGIGADATTSDFIATAERLIERGATIVEAAV